MATQYTNNYDGCKLFSDTCCQMNLAANVEQTYTVPGTSDQKYRAKFTYTANSNVYVGLGVTAAAPTSGTNTTTANLEFRPDELKYVNGGDVIHAITADVAGANMGISLLSITG